jgi:hypothetical protein
MNLVSLVLRRVDQPSKEKSRDCCCVGQRKDESQARRHLLDDFYDFQMCSRVNLLLYNPARYPDSTEPP